MRRYNEYDWLHVRHIAAEDVNSEEEGKSGNENESSDEFGDKSEGSNNGFGDRSEGAGRDKDEKSNAKPRKQDKEDTAKARTKVDDESKDSSDDLGAGRDEDEKSNAYMTYNCQNFKTKTVLESVEQLGCMNISYLRSRWL